MLKLFLEIEERLLRAGVAPRHVRRYLRELGDHFADLKAEEMRAGRGTKEAESAALTRLGKAEDLARAMIEQRHFQSWCGRAPWAVFGLGSLAALGASYFVALTILWTGWQIFLPGVQSPFAARLNVLSMAYFGLGRYLYWLAPVLTGWAIALLAARQRSKIWWPLVGVVVAAFLGSTAGVHVTAPGAGEAAGQVRMRLAVGPAVWTDAGRFWKFVVLATVSVGPYLVWRVGRGWRQAA